MWVLVFLFLLMSCTLPPKKENIPDPEVVSRQYIKIQRHLNQPIHYFDNTLTFQPKRIWRLWVSWDQDLTNQDRAFIVKEFQFIVYEKSERDRLEKDVLDHGGDETYLQWFKDQIMPIGIWDSVEVLKVVRLTEANVVVAVVRSKKSVKKTKLLSLGPIEFPDPLTAQFFEPCFPRGSGNWEQILAGESVGFDIILESHVKGASAIKWKTNNFGSSEFQVASWSVGQGNRISYRRLIQVKASFARCPLPVQVYEVVKLGFKNQEIGIEW